MQIWFTVQSSELSHIRTLWLSNAVNYFTPSLLSQWWGVHCAQRLSVLFPPLSLCCFGLNGTGHVCLGASPHCFNGLCCAISVCSTHIRMNVHTHTHMLTYMYVCTWRNKHTHVHTHAYKYAYAYIHDFVHVHTHTHTPSLLVTLHISLLYLLSISINPPPMQLACFVLSVFMVYFYLSSLMWLAGVALSVLVVIGKNTTFNKLSKGKWIVFRSLKYSMGETGGVP